MLATTRARRYAVMMAPNDELRDIADSTPGSADTQLLANAIRRLSRTNALVVGDAMLDRYVYGDVERVSREAPVPVLCVHRELTVPGGAGNVVRNLVALGAAVAFVSVVGDDQAGSDLTGHVGGQPGVEPWLLVQGGRATTQKTRFVAQGQQMLRADREDTSPIHPKLADRLLRIARDAMAATTITVLSDYRKGVLAGDMPARLIAAARQAGRRVVVDLRGTDYAPYHGADVIMPSRRDLARATGMPVDGDAAVETAAEKLLRDYAFGAVVVTRAEDGMSLVSAHGAWHFRAEAAEVFDASGAGDTAVAALAASLAAGHDLHVAARLANLAAGVVVGKVGIAVAREADLLAAIAPHGGAQRKIVGRDVASERVERWRRTGLKTGFTRGCFDPLTPADAAMLARARAACDRLVIGLAGDKMCFAPHGPGFAPLPAQERARALALLPTVDLIVEDDDETPEELLQALRPDLLVGGSSRADMLGADLVRAWGGRIILADRLTEPAAE
jgi:D-beta-D-heptose 7-phosphate kinase/D-beta-D-heptose 1-phosphate adenosyltransferase